MQEKEHLVLLNKFLEGNMNAEEIERLRQLLHERGQESTWKELIGRSLKPIDETEDVDTDVFFRQLQSRIHAEKMHTVGRRSIVRRLGWVAAAAVIILIGGVWLLTREKELPADKVAVVPVDILPGQDGAVLTLADGRQVVLDSLGNGIVATQNGVQVVLNNGQLAYSGGDGTSGTALFNTISTPRGRQFRMVLPDGTRIWMNSATRLRYPTTFSGNERLVEVSGEAYFEVAADPGKPFRLNIANRAVVDVLGTSFNVNAYEDEPGIHTTLIEGSVRVAATGNRDKAVILFPGQQAQLRSDLKVAENTDIDKVMAWKNGLFNFENMSLEEVMRQLERWYDIQVVYEKGIPDITFGGKMRRDVGLAGLLKSLEESEVHFRIEDRRRLVVVP